MNIIITGASQGIGYQTVLQLGKTGEHHILAISRNEEKLAQLEKEFAPQKHSKLDTLGFDLSTKNLADLKNHITQIFELGKGNTIDVLINNAGYLANKPFMQLEEEDWQRTFDVNLLAAVRLIKMLYPFFNRLEGSHIVNIGSMGGVQGTEKFLGLSAYSASKGAVNILTEALAKEFENENIRANAINPGAVQTEMLEKAFPGFKAPVQPKEMAAYVAHFATTAHLVMNGRIVEASLRS